MCTVDRLETMIEQNCIYFSQLQYLVVDEVDTFLDAGYKDKINKFINIVENSNLKK